MITARRVLLAPCVAFLLAVSTSAALGGDTATTWHVRTNGNNANCDGKVDAPDPGTGEIPRECAFRTPQKAVDTALGGDTILIHAGVYTNAGTTVQGNTNILGIELRKDLLSEETRLVIKSAGDGTVVFDGSGTISSGVTIWGTSYVTIERITFRRFTAEEGIDFQIGAAAINVGSPGPESPSSHLIFKSLFITESSLDNFDGSHAELAIWCADCTNNRIQDCIFESTQPFGIALGHSGHSPVEQNGVLRGNSIRHSRDDQPWVGVLGQQTSVWTVDGNFFDQATLPDPATQELAVVDSTHWAVVNNVFYRPPGIAIHLFNDVVAENFDENHLVLNNTIECLTGTAGVGIRVDSTDESQIRNNIIKGCDSAIMLVGVCQDTQIGFNDLFFNFRTIDTRALPTGFDLVGGDIFTDPQFQAVTPRPDPYYQLQAFSPAIDAGDDAHCGVVPDDGECDMGAFQANASGGNHPPEEPIIKSIEEVSGSTALLLGSGFTDPDVGDIHAASQWQVDVVDGDFSKPEFDSERTTTMLTSAKATGLEPETDYKARVRYQDENFSWSPWSDPETNPGAFFRTLIGTAVPPEVITVVPADGATGVSVAITPVLTFNVPLKAASVKPETIKLKRGDKAVPQVLGSPTLGGEEKVVTITPAGLLDPNATYKIVVKGGSKGVKSRDESIPSDGFTSTFKTETALASSNPENGATLVPLDTIPRLVFKWALDPATVSTSTFKLRDVTKDKALPIASVVLSPDGTTVTITPAAPFKANRKIRVRVVSGGAGIRFADGRKLGSDIKVNFKTDCGCPG